MIVTRKKHKVIITPEKEYERSALQFLIVALEFTYGRNLNVLPELSHEPVELIVKQFSHHQQGQDIASTT